MQSYKSYYMVSPQTVFTYPLHHAKLQILLRGVTANSLYLSSSPYKATSLTTWCHRKRSLLILFTMQSYKSYYMVSPQTVFTYPFHHAKLQILLHGVTANGLYLSFSPCKATNLTTWCHRKQSLLILFTMQSYKSYYMVSPQTVFTYHFHHAKLQILLHGVTANGLYLSFSPCKATNLTSHRKQSLLILFTMQVLLIIFHFEGYQCIPGSCLAGQQRGYINKKWIVRPKIKKPPPPQTCASAFLVVFLGLWNDVQLQPQLLDRLEFCRAVF